MPYRNIHFVQGEIYHVFNRSIARQPIFKDTRDYKRLLQVVGYYRYINPPFRFSYYNQLEKQKRVEVLNTLSITKQEGVEILAFCFMPNHFHFLLKNKDENGISNFMRNMQNSYSKYFNEKTQRTGSLFQAMFKAVHIETDEQLLHVSRYIHLNPVTAGIIQLEKLEDFKWSTYNEYIKEARTSQSANAKYILAFLTSKEHYKSFVLDQADYQKTLEKIKHLSFD